MYVYTYTRAFNGWDAYKTAGYKKTAYVNILRRDYVWYQENSKILDGSRKNFSTIVYITGSERNLHNIVTTTGLKVNMS